MRHVLLAYAATAVPFFALDFIWLNLATASFYKPRLGRMLLDQPDLGVAGLFYLLYVVGVVAFAVMPALAQGHWQRAGWSGALLGLVAYGTYDMTNLATLAGWPLAVSVVDMAWGTVLTGAAAMLGYAIVRLF